ncbi:MAG: hypothetical protein ACRCYR_14925 [Phycicoccus sp.]
MTPQLPVLPSGPLSLDAARKLGLSDHQWRLTPLQRITQTVRDVVSPGTPAARAAAYALALPDDVVFSHVTAARLWGLPLPRHLEARVELDVQRRSGRPAIERRGCISHRGLESRSVSVLDGLRVTSLADTWVDLGEIATRGGFGRDDLVVAGDAALGRHVPTASPAEDDDLAPLRPETLAAVLAARVRPRGGVVLAEALGLLRAGVRSPMETRARLVFHDAGFPEPEVNAPVTTPDGGWLAEGDLVWRTQRVVGEYQGEVHADRARRSADADRAGVLRDWGWTVLEIFAEDVFSPARRSRLLRRVAAALGLPLE